MRQKALLNLHVLAEYQTSITLDLVRRLLGLPRRRPLLKTMTRRQIASRMIFLSHELARFEFNPYRVSFSDVAGELRIVAKDLIQLGQSNWVRAIPALEVTWRSLLIKQRQIELERIIFALTRRHYGIATRLTLDEAVKRIRLVEKFFEVLDDSRFKRRVRTAVLGHLASALQALPADPKAAREFLKSASELL